MRRSAAIGLLLVLMAPACSSETPSATTRATSTTATTEGIPAYLDPARPVEERIDDLLSRMTLDEKIGQMTLVHQGAVTPVQVREWGFGAILSGGGGSPDPNTPEAWVEMTSGFQAAALETRLAIPLLYGSDAVHGHNNLFGAVIFPHNIGLGAAGSADLVERIARATAVEAAATGVSWNYAPVLAVPRDIRWGRTYEAFAEDPELVSELGAAYVRGLQGTELTAADAILATPKHFVGDGAAEWGTSTTATYRIDQGDTDIDEATLRAVHLLPYHDSLDAGALVVMASYSSWEGTKVHASRYLLTDVLKDEMRFEGFVVSDWAAIDQIDPDDYYRSVVTAVNAGIDMNMVPAAYHGFMTDLRRAVDTGDVSKDRIDDAVRRILRAKFAAGLFEQPYPDGALLEAIGSDEHRALAAEAVERSLVLLTNDGTTLPVDAGTIFVAGAAADDIGRQSGGWTITWQGGSGPITIGSSILDGIEEHAGEAAVFYDRNGRFVDAPERADVGIAVIGEYPYAEGAGDNSRLQIHGSESLLALRDRVDRLIVIVLSGRPVSVDPLMEAADVLIAAWLPGSEGAAVAAPLFGTAEFTGRLPFTWPRHAGQLPFDFETLPDGGCEAPAFGYGHGLSTDESYRLPTLECEEAA